MSQPPVTPCSFIQRGTPSSIVTAQITRVLPIETSSDPLACGATFNSKLSGRISSGPRPSLRCIGLEVRCSWHFVRRTFFAAQRLRTGIASNRQPYDKVVDEQRRWQEKQSLVRCQVVCQAELRRDRTRSAKAMRSERKKEQPDFRGRAHHRAHISVRTG